MGDGLGSQNSGRMSYEYCEWINGGLNGRNGFVPQSFDWTISFVSVLGDVVYMFHEAETPTYGTDGNGAKFAHVVRRTSAYLRYDGSTDTFDWVYGFPHKPRGEYIENTTWQDADMGFCFGMSGSPSEEKALLFSNIVGLYYTADGQNFRQLNSLFRGADELTFTAGDGTSEKKSLQRLSSTGVDVICTHTVVPDPFDRDHLLVCSTDIGLVQSYDGGSSFYRSLHEWQSGKLVNIDYATYTNTCFDAHFDEKRRGVVYGIWSQAKSAPYEPGTGYLNGDSRFGVSYDGGLSWQMKKITPTGKCLPYRMQVVYEGDERAIYIATDGHGFFVTRDLGDTFTAMNDGIEPAASGGVSAIWGNELLVCDMGIFAVTGGVASSEDNGKMLYEWDESSKRFKKLGLPQAVSEYDGKTYTPAAIRDIVYDKKENCLYLACVANVATNYASISYVAGGIWKYKDGAFTQIYDHTRSVASLATDGEGRLYAIEPNGKLIRFADPSSPPETLLDGLFHKLKTVCMGADDRTLFIASWGGGTYKITLTEK